MKRRLALPRATNGVFWSFLPHVQSRSSAHVSRHTPGPDHRAFTFNLTPLPCSFHGHPTTSPSQAPHQEMSQPAKQPPEPRHESSPPGRSEPSRLKAELNSSTTAWPPSMSVQAAESNRQKRSFEQFSSGGGFAAVTQSRFPATSRPFAVATASVSSSQLPGVGMQPFQADRGQHTGERAAHSQMFEYVYRTSKVTRLTHILPAFPRRP